MPRAKVSEVKEASVTPPLTAVTKPQYAIKIIDEHEMNQLPFECSEDPISRRHVEEMSPFTTPVPSTSGLAAPQVHVQNLDHRQEREVHDFG